MGSCVCACVCVRVRMYVCVCVYMCVGGHGFDRGCEVIIDVVLILRNNCSEVGMLLTSDLVGKYE